MLKPGERIAEIDALRGVAILLMVIFHIVVDLTDFYDYSYQYISGFWYYEGKAAAILFMLLAGISASLGRSPLRHGVQLLLWGMALSTVTWLIMPETYIRFGILHFLGTSLMSWILVKRQRPGTLLLLAAVCIGLGQPAAALTADTPLLLPFGIMPAGFASIDYYPLFPWYGVFLAGAAAGIAWYGQRQSLTPYWSFPSVLCWMGRRSLAIYLVHQPIILALLYLLL